MNATSNESGLLNILLVEDNDDDVCLTREGMTEAGISAQLHHVANGSECMNYLRRQGRYSDRKRPDLVLLDLNMPVMDGREVLAELRRDEALSVIPVVMLTTSSAHEDIEAAYRLAANAYVIKPTSFDEFVLALRSIGAFWLNASGARFDRLPAPTTPRNRHPAENWRTSANLGSAVRSSTRTSKPAGSRHSDRCTLARIADHGKPAKLPVL